MASTTLTARLLSTPEQFLTPLYHAAKELPLYLLLLLFVGFWGLVYLAVRLETAPSPPPPLANIPTPTD